GGGRTMSQGELLLFGLLVFLFALKPGPGVIFFSTLAVAEGLGPALITAVGTDIGHFLIVVALMASSSILNIDQRWLFGAQIIASLYFIYLGIKYYRTDASSVSSAKRSLSNNPLVRILQGMTWSVANPANIAFYATVGPTWFLLKKNASLS